MSAIRVFNKQSILVYFHFFKQKQSSSEMPFICNGFNWKLVGDKKFAKFAKQYDGYVVARCLFVSSETSFSNDVSKILKL